MRIYSTLPMSSRTDSVAAMQLIQSSWMSSADGFDQSVGMRPFGRYILTQASPSVRAFPRAAASPVTRASAANAPASAAVEESVTSR